MEDDFEEERQAAFKEGYREGVRIGLLEGFRGGVLEGAIPVAKRILALRARLAAIRERLTQQQTQGVQKTRAARVLARLQVLQGLLDRYVPRNVEDAEREISLDQLTVRIRELEAFVDPSSLVSDKQDRPLSF